MHLSVHVHAYAYVWRPQSDRVPSLYWGRVSNEPRGSLTGSPSSRILSSLISWRGKLPCPPGMCIDVRHPNSGRHDHKTNVLPTETPPPHIWSPHTSSSVGVTADSTCGTFLSRLCDFFSLITSLSFGSLVVDTSPRAWVGMFLSDGSGTPSRF